MANGARFKIGDEEFACIAIDAPSDRDYPELTSEERAVCVHILAGLSTVEIAEARGVSPKTIENQTTSIFRKLGVFSRSELVVLALERGRRRAD
ncbi:MAG: response regulator transcription factor [Myxococcales bacterium]|nr:response regulator transcription factor [Myxococcales bacterium]